jgi:CBS domain-containing protein
MDGVRGDGATTAQRVRIYLAEDGPFAAILDLLRREGCAGASVFKGIAGFGVHGQIHTAALVDLAGPLPLVVEWVDTPERVERLLPTVLGMVDGLVTVEAVGVVKCPQPTVRDVPSHTLVKDVMTPTDRVDAASPGTGLRELVELLLRKRRNAIPVIDAERRVVGIITNTDLVTRAGLPLRLELLRALGEADAPDLSTNLAPLEGEGRTAGSIMTPEVVTIGPDVPLTEAARLMLLRRLKRLPVVDAEGRLLGIVSRFDILKTVSPAFAKAPAPQAAARRLNNHLPRRIGEVMNRDVPMVRLDTPLPEVLDAVMSTRLHRALVVDEERRPVGGIVDTDLMQRVTPAAHPGLFGALMRRVRPTSPEERAEWQLRTAQRAADVMRPLDRLVVVTADTDIAEAIGQALAKGVKVVVVTDDQGRTIGMADRADLLGALAAAI